MPTKKLPTQPEPLHIKARELLRTLWMEIESTEISALPFDATLTPLVRSVINGREKGYRQSIYIQLLGKATDVSLDARCLQDKYTGKGAWDAREFAKKVFVPWHKSLQSPLGESDDPYVSNVFRHPCYGKEMERDRKDKETYAKAAAIIFQAQQSKNRDDAAQVLRIALAELRRLLQDHSLEFSVPLRVSLAQSLATVNSYLSKSSGGSRLQAIVYAALKTFALRTRLFDRVHSRHINAADAASGAVGDVECFTADKLVAVFEVKDRALDLAETEATIAKARVAAVNEIFFVVRAVPIFKSGDQAAIERQIASEFSVGINLYVISHEDLITSILAFCFEGGRRDFMREVGTALEETRADYQHRLAWAKIVRAIGAGQ